MWFQFNSLHWGQVSQNIEVSGKEAFSGVLKPLKGEGVVPASIGKGKIKSLTGRGGTKPLIGSGGSD